MNDGLKQPLPVLPIIDAVLFPHVVMPLRVHRPASVAAVEAAVAGEEKRILVFAQKGAASSTRPEDLYPVGTHAVIRSLARRSDGILEIVVLGIERARISTIEQTEPYIRARSVELPLPCDFGTEVEALRRSVIELAVKALVLVAPDQPVDPTEMIGEIESPARLAYVLGSMFHMDVPKAQAVLESESCLRALELVHAHLSYETSVLLIREKIRNEAASELSREAREHVLRKQMRAIQRELGEEDSEDAEIALLRDRLSELDAPEEARKEAERELQKLSRLPQAAMEYHVSRAYFDLILDLPWRVSGASKIDIVKARAVLDEDHDDLEEVKKRVIEHLSVLSLNPTAKAPILCFVGPPGVGKTSVGQSIARALGRNFERMSLGGLHDEAELRGHRRTYVGAMPGRIIQAIRRARVNDPVLMLDEIDKIGRDFRGDPASALLEVLDPAQNFAFHDNYLDVPFDLSKVLFLTTANALDPVPPPLRDRLEVLHLPGYTEEEKIGIATRFLLPRLRRDVGLAEAQFTLSDEVLRHVIARYTREAGVRQLERAISKMLRAKAVRFAEGSTDVVPVRIEDLPEILGPMPFFPERTRETIPPGVAIGLAWTEAGGDVLYVESALLPGGEGVMLTGQLGDVMQESARAARSYLWSHASALEIDPARIMGAGVHVHVPAGAIPKDGPSAGITLATALASLYLDRPVRADLALTGEITLTGLVLPVGGLKEKILAARRAGIRKVILPRANEQDLRALSDDVRKDMEVIFVDRFEEALRLALATPAVASKAGTGGVRPVRAEEPPRAAAGGAEGAWHTRS